VVRGARNLVQLAEDAENAVGIDVVGCHIFWGLKRFSYYMLG
jgi:hypothetical protein